MGAGSGRQTADAHQAYFKGPDGTESILYGSQFTQEGSGCERHPWVPAESWSDRTRVRILTAGTPWGEAPAQPDWEGGGPRSS